MVTGAGGGMGLQIARDLRGRRQGHRHRRQGSARGARGRGLRPGDVSDERFVAGAIGAAFAESGRPRLPGQRRGRAVVRARPLAARHRSRDLEPGDRDQPHRLHADRAARDPADAPDRRRRDGAFRRPSACAATTGPRTPTRSPRPASSRSRSRSRSSSRPQRSARTSSCRARPRARCRRAGKRTWSSSGRPPPACRSAASGPRTTWRAPACSCSPTRPRSSPAPSCWSTAAMALP